MICEWLNEEALVNEKYYNLSLKPETTYANPVLDQINRLGLLDILKQPTPNLSIPLELAPLHPKATSYYYGQSTIEHSSFTTTIICINPTITALPVKLIEDELLKIRSKIKGELLLFSGGNWKGKEAELLSTLSAFMNVFGRIPKTIEFQTIGWGNDLKQSLFYLVGQRWFYSDSYFRHLLLSKGAQEIQLHSFVKHQTTKEIQLSRYHSMFLAKPEHSITSLISEVDLNDLISLQNII